MPSGSTLVLVAGYAGSGKTECGRLLSRHSKWALFEKDTMTRPLVEGLLQALGAHRGDRHSDTYLTKVRPLEYECLLNAGLLNISLGSSTILSAPFLLEVTDTAWIDRLSHRCAARRAVLRIAWVHSDAESMHSQLSSRNAYYDAWKLAHWDEYFQTIDLDMRPARSHRVIDNTRASGRSLAEQVQVLFHGLAS